MTEKRSLIPDNGELLHEEGHPMLGFRVFALLAEIIQHKETLGLPAKWNRHYELGKNKHWRQQPKKGVALVTANLLHTHRTRTVNMLTDNNPTFNVKRTGEMAEGQEELYNILLKSAEWWWGETEQQGVLEKSVNNGETYGLTVEKILFNPEIEWGMGEVETCLVDPFHIGWWPVKQPDLQKCEGVFNYYPITVREARRRWPKFKDKIKSDKELLDKLSDTRMEVQANSTRRGLAGYMSNFASSIKHILNLAGGGSKEEGDEVLVCEAWAKDYTRNGDGEKEMDKYSGNIRRVTVLNGGELVVDDRDNPSINPELDTKQASQTYLWDKFPFIKAESVNDTGQPWGMSDFEQLEMLNIEVNKTISQFTMVKDRIARIKLINPKDSGVTNEQFTNAPGIIQPSSSLVAAAIRYLDPPKIDNSVMEALSIYKELFFLVAGTFDMEQADATGKNVIAYKAIAALLERAATMLRGKLRNYGALIRERGRMYVSLMQNWYTEDRFISYEEDGADMVQQIRGSELIIPARLTVVSGSTMPTSKIQQREEALALFDKGAIDGEELLKNIEWPDWKKVIGRMKMGPVGEFLEKLQMMGFPPSMIAAFQEIGTLEFNDFEKALENGEIPMLPQLLQPPPGEEGGPPAEPEVPPDIQAEVELKAAQVRKVDAEIRLIDEKINTERVNQSATVAGVQFDKTKLTQEQARLVHEIQSGNRDQVIKGAETAIKKKDSETKEHVAKKTQGPYREKGMKSNNKQKK